MTCVRARGGKATVDNLRVVCRAHNALDAEKEFGREHIAEKIEERRKKKQEKAGPQDHDDRPRPEETFELALRALKSMGFKDPEVRRAVTTLRDRHRDMRAPAIESLVREALSLLT